MWAVGLVGAVTRGTSPWPAVCVVLVAVTAAVSRRDPAAPPVLRMFAVVAGAATTFRLAGLVLLGSGSGETILLRLPTARVWPGITLGGPLTAESLRAVAYSTAQLVAVLACLAAACELAPPRRLLPYLPAGLYEVGTAVVVGLTFAPQVAQNAAAVRTARRLRAPHASRRALRDLVLLAGPVLDASLDRSLALAASMESRGFARRAHRSRGRERLMTTLALGGLVGVVVAVFTMLGTGGPTPASGMVLAAGVTAAVAALVTGRRSGRTRYRPDPWGRPETLLVTAGLVATGAAWWSAATEPGAMNPDPALALPAPPLVACVALLVPALAAGSTPPVESW